MSNDQPPMWAERSEDASGSDHERALAILELAAAEPGGFDRLEAGDTEEAAWLAGHLAGCGSCTAEYPRVRRLAAAVRTVIRETPPPELRGRTLHLVQAAGRERSATALEPAETTSDVATRRTREKGSRPGKWVPVAWLAGVAAAVAISVGLTTALVGVQVNEALTRERTVVAAFANVTREQVVLLAQPDARIVGLTGDPGGASGSLLYSPSQGELSVVATGLAEPAAGAEYRCWLEIDGTRRRVGRMRFAGGVAYWVGPSEDLAAIQPGSRFGVTLVTADGTPAGDVLTGEL